MAKKKVLLLVDMNEEPPKDHDYSKLLRTEIWSNEKQILKSLERLGYDAKMFGLFEDISPLLDELKQDPPDVVFNSCEAFRDDRKLEPNIVAAIELFGIPVTGAPSLGLQLCKDKGLTKKILSYHGIRVPEFVVSHRASPIRSLKQFSYPAFIKPLGGEASEGIAQLSFAETEKACLDRVHFIHEKLQTDAIIEEFIDGRELYVSVMGNSQLTVFPPREIFFTKKPKEEPRFTSYKAKWDDDYRKRWGIRWGPARKIDEQIMKELITVSKTIYRLFHLQGYGRIDLRLKESGELYFLEANPNPSLCQDD